MRDHAHTGNLFAQLGYEVNASRAGRANNGNFHHDGRGSVGRECLAVRPMISTASDAQIAPRDLDAKSINAKSISRVKRPPSWPNGLFLSGPSASRPPSTSTSPSAQAPWRPDRRPDALLVRDSGRSDEDRAWIFF
jgi:hypothetical protein